MSPEPARDHLAVLAGDPVAGQLGLGAVALRYAALGIPVFPLRSGSKKPMPGRHGFQDASTDPAVIGSTAWWGGDQTLNVAGALGRVSGGMFVVDLDKKSGADGVAALTSWLAERGLTLPDAP